MYGFKQKRLALDDEEVLESLWEGFTPAQREEVITRYGRLITAALRDGDTTSEEDTNHDENPDG